MKLGEKWRDYISITKPLFQKTGLIKCSNRKYGDKDIFSPSIFINYYGIFHSNYHINDIIKGFITYILYVYIIYDYMYYRKYIFHWKHVFIYYILLCIVYKNTYLIGNMYFTLVAAMRLCLANF